MGGRLEVGGYRLVYKGGEKKIERRQGGCRVHEKEGRNDRLKAERGVEGSEVKNPQDTGREARDRKREGERQSKRVTCN